jgi:hypothetical protein
MLKIRNDLPIHASKAINNNKKMAKIFGCPTIDGALYKKPKRISDSGSGQKTNLKGFEKPNVPIQNKHS